MKDKCNPVRNAPRVAVRRALLDSLTRRFPRVTSRWHWATPPRWRSFGIAQCLAAWLLMLVGVLDGADTQVALLSSGAAPRRELGFESRSTNIWENGVGDGFRSGVESVGLSIGANYGVAMLGGRESHHLALASLSYGRVLGPVRGGRRWYRGNWELRGELFSGAEFSPDTEWLVGLTPHLRYNFATGTGWIPFVDLGAGVTATSIGPPDLSGTFEFNLQACGGTHWFIKEHVALTLEARYLHLSCARISNPNLGLNGVTGLVGLTFFF